MCLAEGYNTVTPVRLEPAAARSGVKQTSTHFYDQGSDPNLDLDYLVFKKE